MEFLEQRVYDEKTDKTICKFWIDETGEVDLENLPHPEEIGLLLKTLRLRNVEIEFTGRIENE